MIFRRKTHKVTLSLNSLGNNDRLFTACKPLAVKTYDAVVYESFGYYNSEEEGRFMVAVINGINGSGWQTICHPEELFEAWDILDRRVLIEKEGFYV